MVIMVIFFSLSLDEMMMMPFKMTDEVWRDLMAWEGLITMLMGKIYYQGYFVGYFLSCATTREINTEITLEQAQKQLIMRVHILFYF